MAKRAASQDPEDDFGIREKVHKVDEYKISTNDIFQEHQTRYQ